MIELLLGTLGELCFLLAYVSGKTSFPPPLTAREEMLCIEGMERGDEEARGKLIEHNLRLVAHVAKKYQLCGIEQEDLISIGAIGLIKAVGTFKPSAGTQLATYAARCIENEILMAIRSRRRIKSEVSLNEPVGVDREGNEISLIDVLGSEENAVENEVEQRARLRAVLRLIRTVLTDKERVVICQRYGLNGLAPKPQREVAKALDISRSYVSRIEKRAVEKLRDALERETQEI